MNEILKCIEERRSTKCYKPDLIPSREDVDAVIKAGLEAASGRNMQAPIIVAVTNKDVRARLAEFNGSLYGKADPFYGAPVILIVLARRDAHTYVYDGSLVLGNMMLAAHSLGLGSCWIHRAKETFERPEWRAWLDEIGVPEDVEGIGHLALGYTEGKFPRPKERKPGRVFYVD